MAKTLIGIDIGHQNLKLAVVKGKKVKRTAVYPMPDSLLKDGRITSVEALGELIRKTMKENKLHASHAAVSLNDQMVYTRNLTMPLMTVDQLEKNLPYEFRDYISDELKNYLYDYAVVEKREDSMDLLAVAMPKEMMDLVRSSIRKAGLHFDIAGPSVSAFRKLISVADNQNPNKERCIIDIGAHSIRVFIMQGAVYKANRVLEFGIEQIDERLAEELHVDVHLAHTYLEKNFENCQENPEIQSAFDHVANELRRVVQFYKFSNPESELEDAYLFGGGAKIEPLARSIDEHMELTVHDASELAGFIGDVAVFAEAAGIALS